MLALGELRSAVNAYPWRALAAAFGAGVGLALARSSHAASRKLGSAIAGTAVDILHELAMAEPPAIARL